MCMQFHLARPLYPVHDTGKYKVKGFNRYKKTCVYLEKLNFPVPISMICQDDQMKLPQVCESIAHLLRVLP